MRVKNIKIKNRHEFIRTIAEIISIPEMTLNHYILKTDMKLTESEFRHKYLVSRVISKDDFKSLIIFFNRQKEENKAEIEKAKNNNQINSLINKLISLTSFNTRELDILEINTDSRMMDDDKKNILKVKKERIMKALSISKTAKSRKKIEKTSLNKTPVSNIADKKNGRRLRFASTPFTANKAEAFSTIVDKFKITPFSKKYDKLPISSTNFYNMKTGKKNGQDLSLSKETINKIADYLIPIIQNILTTLQPSEQEKLKTNFELFSGQTFPSIKAINQKSVNENKIKKPKELLKNSGKKSSQSILLTVKGSIALEQLCFILKLKSKYYQEGGIPVSAYSLHYWQKPTEKFASKKKIFLLRDYFQNIIDSGKSDTISDKDWITVKQNWKILNSEISADEKIKSLSVKSEVEAVDIPKQEKMPKASKINHESDETTFVLNHREFIKKKLEADHRLEKILVERKKERTLRDRNLKIQDALKDMPILSTLALSKEKHFSEKVYELIDFVISDKNNKSAKIKNMEIIDFISQNPEVDSSNSQIHLTENEYKEYNLLREEAKKDTGKVEVKLILDNDSKLNLYLNYSF